ncbi:hypothetical protein J3R30DRAFT_3405850 [Lentinula aciculospora]|uniref:N-acetyltransferase domain-containing protein n=1 Tax=Lentinula aciculospora TaxID=153920 RepID=A0A9W9DL49_9AGAR|nr:hypothetical protein J3R30DRAFT_3405850 [Lentinula aciculospora]
MPEYSYRVIPIPVSSLLQSHVDKYTSLRLLALGTNPESFSSNQDEERQFSPEQWRGRIDTDDRVTLIAVASKQNSDTSSSSSSSTNSSFINSSTLLDDDKSEWVGLITVLSPEFLKERMKDLPLKFQEFAMWLGEPAHVLVSMWVHPEHRRKGLGGRLISGAIDWVKSRTVVVGQSAAVLEVLVENKEAVELYRRLGFEDIEKGSHSIWMGKKINQRIA